jgi:hypothetical protein
VNSSSTRRSYYSSFAPSVVLGVALTLTVLPAQAWDDGVHSVIAKSIRTQLPRDIQASLKRVLGRELEDVGPWSRGGRPGGDRTQMWHFLRVPESKPQIDMSRDCRVTKNGDCILAALNRYQTILNAGGTWSEARREALQRTVHLVADIHDPSHVGFLSSTDGFRNVPPCSPALVGAWVKTLGLSNVTQLRRVEQYLPADTPSYLTWATETLKASSECAAIARMIGQPGAPGSKSTATRRFGELLSRQIDLAVMRTSNTIRHFVEKDVKR